MKTRNSQYLVHVPVHVDVPSPWNISENGPETVRPLSAPRLTLSSHTMPDSSGRELQVDVTYANIGLVFGSKLMNESPLAVHGRESRRRRRVHTRAGVPAGHAHAARAFDCSGMDFA